MPICELKPCMSENELRLFTSFLECSDHYFEFGSGGSTCLAARNVKKSVSAVDSSQEWLIKVAEHCREHALPVQPRLCHIDIGPTAAWGYPTDEKTRHRWPFYHREFRAMSGEIWPDLCLVDGRFRVASFMQIVLSCTADTLIMVHDFASRPHYHVVLRVAREIARAENISAFVPNRAMEKQALLLLEEHEFDPR